jgi:hypothetical protein
MGGATSHRRTALTLGFLSADVPGLVALSPSLTESMQAIRLSVIVPLVRPVVYISPLLEALDTVLLETETTAEVLLVPLALSSTTFVPRRNYSFSVRCLHEESTPLSGAWLSSSTYQPCCATGAAGSAGAAGDEEEGAAEISSHAAGGAAGGAAAGAAEASGCTCGDEPPIFSHLFEPVAEPAEAPAAALAAAFNRGGEAAAGETLLLLSDLAELQPGAWAALQAAHEHA